MIYLIKIKEGNIMNRLNFNYNWNFKDIQTNIEALVNQFEGLLSPFLCYNLKEKIEILRSLKKQVFEYNNILYWQRERLWEVLNKDFDINEFKNL